MINVTLPDGSIKSFDSSLSVGAIARSIAPSLGKAAVAGRLNGQLVDLGHSVSEDAELAIITGSDVEGLEVIRHSTAHLLAHAVKVLYPAAQVTIGPVIDDGFFYDFARKEPFTSEDLKKIENDISISRIDKGLLKSFIDSKKINKIFRGKPKPIEYLTTSKNLSSTNLDWIGIPTLTTLYIISCLHNLHILV